MQLESELVQRNHGNAMGIAGTVGIEKRWQYQPSEKAFKKLKENKKWVVFRLGSGASNCTFHRSLELS